MEPRRWLVWTLWVALSAVGCAPDGPPAEEVGVARAPLVLTEQQKLTAGDGEDGDFFGWAVAIDGDTAIIGAPQGDGAFGNSDFYDPGAAYVFTRTGGVWTQTQKLTGGTFDPGDHFGNAIAL